MIRSILFSCFWLTSAAGMAQPTITVSQDGSGDHRTLQGALNSLPDTGRGPRRILVRNGIYREKIYLEKANVVIEGEDRDKTILIASIARDEWRCGHMDDWGVATLNVGASDVTLRNLTVTNDFGFSFTPRSIHCASDTTPSRQRTLRRDGHQMALRAMNGATRLRAIHCRFRAYGGDTVSPWDVENGMWYFKDCILEGGVDFYCPRGWAWAEDCLFIAHSGTAAIWHDGSAHADAKTVLKGCRFTGYDGFLLGRYHRDAQFYLVDCSFAANMGDRPIYRVPTDNRLQWGDRVFYAGCRKEGGMDYVWYRDNLPQGLRSDRITLRWLFGARWNPSE
jgi:pectinesterase